MGNMFQHVGVISKLLELTIYCFAIYSMTVQIARLIPILAP